MDYSPPGSSVHEIFQARIMEWGLLLGIFLTQGSHPRLLRLLQWRRIVYPCTIWEAHPALPSDLSVLVAFITIIVNRGYRPR